MMKRTALLTVMALSGILISASNGGSNGNGGTNSNSGSGGNTNNNGNGNYILIYHHHGNGQYSMMSVTPGAAAQHGNHGDLWYYTGCPLSGPENACY